jgi:hypothetical protein
MVAVAEVGEPTSEQQRRAEDKSSLPLGAILAQSVPERPFCVHNLILVLCNNPFGGQFTLTAHF